jgi:hypothetical protein
MTTLTLCLGMFLAICGQVREFDYQTAEACEQARKAMPASVIGRGYAICAPKKESAK